MKLSAVDIVFFALIFLLTLRGFLRGLSGEVFSIASLSLALVAGALFFRAGASFVRERYLDTAILPELLAFAVIFLSVFIAAKLVERIVKDIIERLHLASLDRALGLLFGLAKSLALVILVLAGLALQPLFDPAPLLARSLFARLLLPLTGAFGV